MSQGARPPATNISKEAWRHPCGDSIAAPPPATAVVIHQPRGPQAVEISPASPVAAAPSRAAPRGAVGEVPLPGYGKATKTYQLTPKGTVSLSFTFTPEDEVLKAGARRRGKAASSATTAPPS